MRLSVPVKVERRGDLGVDSGLKETRSALSAPKVEAKTNSSLDVTRLVSFTRVDWEKTNLVTLAANDVSERAVDSKGKQ